MKYLNIPKHINTMKSLEQCIVIIFMMVSVIMPAQNPADFDLSFSEDGWDTLRVFPGLENNWTQNRIVPLSDDKILLMGNETSPFEQLGVFLIRMNADGTLDSSFGNNGYSRSLEQTNNSIRGHTLLELPDGKFLIVGNDNNPLPCLFVCFTQDGELDNSYGNGMGNVRLPAFFTGFFYSSVVEYAFLQPSGKIVVSCTYTRSNNAIWESKHIIFRVNQEGELDLSFGIDGKIETTWGDTYGKTAPINNNEFLICYLDYDGAHYNATFKKYDADGNQDLDYGTQGQTYIPMLFDIGSYPTPEYIYQVADDSGRLYMMNHEFNSDPTVISFSAIRLNESGIQDLFAIDPAFAVINYGGFPKIFSYSGSLYAIAGDGGVYDVLIKFDNSGNYDSGFNETGILSFSQFGASGATIADVAFDDNGSIFIYGQTAGDDGNGLFDFVAKLRGGESNISVIETQQSELFSAYPNPVNNHLNILFSKDSRPKQLVLTDSVGRIISSQTINTSSIRPIDMSVYERGVYILQVHYDDGTKQTQRLLKQ